MDTRFAEDTPAGDGSSGENGNASSFAGLLAALTAPPATKPAKAGWDDDGLADDVATLSYENALRAHGRYRAGERDDRSLTEPGKNPGPVDSYELASEEAAAAERLHAGAARAQGFAQAELARRAVGQLERNLKSASVTIRLSQAEATQLHCRAAEAGLTVSAYLRSCAFEADSLRTMVKETMAELRASASTGKAGQDGGLGRWLRRVLMPWRAHREMARA